MGEIAKEYIEGEPQIAKDAVNPDEEAGHGGEQIKGAKTEDSTVKEGTVYYDIRFYAATPRSKEKASVIINVEAQNDFYPGYPIIKRGIYYCSRMISSQYGVEFVDTHYEQIKKVYSIWVCVNPPKYRENTITRYAMQEENLIGKVSEKKENYDLLTAVMICLGHSGDDKYAGILKLLDVLLSSENEPEKKIKILSEDFGIKMIKEIESEVSTLCNLSKSIEERGIERGIREGVLVSIQNLMESMGWSAEQAMSALKIPETDQSVYADNIRKQYE